LATPTWAICEDLTTAAHPLGKIRAVPPMHIQYSKCTKGQILFWPLKVGRKTGAFVLVKDANISTSIIFQ
jgi:hypothetical protein